jgi:hypothetical protein
MQRRNSGHAATKWGEAGRPAARGERENGRAAPLSLVPGMEWLLPMGGA